MFFLEVLLLSLALCVDSFVVSTTCAFKSKMTYGRGVVMATVFAVCQALFPLLGAVLGLAFKDFISAVDHWVAFGLLLLVGGKMILDSIRNVPEERQFDMSRFGLIVMLGVATSIDAFVVGIGLGLDNSFGRILVYVLMIGLTTFVVSMIGLFLGKRNIPVPERVATLLAGLVLVSLGTYMLVEHLTQG